MSSGIMIHNGVFCVCGLFFLVFFWGGGEGEGEGGSYIYTGTEFKYLNLEIFITGNFFPSVSLFSDADNFTSGRTRPTRDC